MIPMCKNKYPVLGRWKTMIRFSTDNNTGYKYLQRIIFLL